MTPVILSLGLPALSCGGVSSNPASPDVESKISSGLQFQFGLREQQLTTPTASRLVRMQDAAMSTKSINMQRIYIYLAQPPTEEQTNDLKTLGVILYPDSWIPPFANQPAGFMWRIFR